MDNEDLQKEFAPPQESRELKKLGFDKPCLGLYREDDSFLYADVFSFREAYSPSELKEGVDEVTYYLNSEILEELTSAPTFSQAFRWFDENTELKGFVAPGVKEEHFDWLIRIDWEEEIECEEAYSSRPEAELACLRKLIEIAKSKNNE